MADSWACTWPEPSARADQLCHTAGTARWWTVWGFLVVRCPRHFREEAAAAAEALGWAVERRGAQEDEPVAEAQPQPAAEPPRRQAPEGWTTPEGYTFSNVATCRSCPARIAWHLTTAGRKAPLNPDGTSHFSSCPGAEQHRRPRT